MDNRTVFAAAEYDQKIRDTIPFYDLLHSETLRIVREVVPGVRSWVDTGCGTGHLVQQALGAFPDTHFIMADPSDGMLKQARGRLSNIGGARCQILPPVGSAGLLSHLSPGSADILTAIQCHHYLKREERLEALQACYAVLKPGGLFVCFENIAPCTPEGVRIGLNAWKAFLMDHGRTEQEASQHVTRYDREFFPITAEEHLAALTQTGFRVGELFWFSQMQGGFYALK